MFYALGHFSKFIPEGSYAVGFELIEESSQDVDVTALLTPSDNVVVVLVNK